MRYAPRFAKDEEGLQGRPRRPGASSARSCLAATSTSPRPRPSSSRRRRCRRPRAALAPAAARHRRPLPTPAAAAADTRCRPPAAPAPAVAEARSGRAPGSRAGARRARRSRRARPRSRWTRRSYEATLKELLDAGTDRRIAEGKARRAAHDRRAQEGHRRGLSPARRRPEAAGRRRIDPCEPPRWTGRWDRRRSTRRLGHRAHSSAAGRRPRRLRARQCERARMREDFAELVPARGVADHRLHRAGRGGVPLEGLGHGAQRVDPREPQRPAAAARAARRARARRASRVAPSYARKAMGAQAGALFGYVARARARPVRRVPAARRRGAAVLRRARTSWRSEQRFGLPARDFRLWVAIHEVTHRVQFGAAPWLRGHLARARRRVPRRRLARLARS